MRHLHSLGIVHRDLKPENVCFTTAEQRWIKLIDLGAAGVLQGGDTDGGGLSELCGTPLYAAPEVTPWFYVKTDEQAARCRRYGKEVDYWSMGITLFVMLSGEAYRGPLPALTRARTRTRTLTLTLTLSLTR